MELNHYIALDPYWRLFLVIPGIFLAVFVFQLFFGHLLKHKGNAIVLAANVAALAIAGYLFMLFGGEATMPDKIVGHWIDFRIDDSELFRIDASIFQDGTTALMLLLITLITLMVQVFSISYMQSDPKRNRYWAYLGLFAFSMTGLVLASGLEFIFIFWELVGVSSYFLIGFWHEEKLPAVAAQKAMIINRLGDIGFFSGLMILMWQFGYLNLTHLTNLAGQGDPFWVGIAGILILAGVFSKSAQFPLQVWLPDAMAGPTPASALIHAATMVVAGVYLLFRCIPFIGEYALTITAFIGGITAVMAAYSAITQTDIKKVLAYSTISQLGFMMVGLGTGAYEMAFLHLITHAFFKAGLFLVAGSVIHAMHTLQHDLKHEGIEADFDPQDIRWMGGLRKRMPKTFIAYMILAASLMGMPFFSGFLSKDGILTGALGWASEGPAAENLGIWAWLPAILGFAAAFMTAFYMTRHAILIFWGENRLHLKLDNARAHFERIREVPATMWVPVALLALASLGQVFAPGHLFAHEAQDFWALRAMPVYDAEAWGMASQEVLHAVQYQFHSTAMMVSIILAFAGLALGWVIYRNSKPGLDDTRGFGARLSFSHFFLDIFYEKYIARLFLWVMGTFAAFDKRVVDGTVNFLADAFVGRTDDLSMVAAGAETASAQTSAAKKRKRRSYSLSGFAGWWDEKVIDGMVNGLAAGIGWMAKVVRRSQPGKIQLYIAFTVVGLLLLLMYLIYFGA